MVIGKISGQVALVTEADSGIGRAVSETFAGEGASVVDVEETPLGDWKRVIGFNLTGTFLGSKHTIRAMNINGGAIAIICSVTGIAGHEDFAAHSASNGGVTTFTKTVPGVGFGIMDHRH